MSPYVYIYMSKQLVVVNKRRPARRRAAPRRQRIPLPVVVGQGTYSKIRAKPRSTTTSVPYGSMIGGGIGTALGGPVGGMIGGGVGHLAQKLIKHFTGFGDYSIEVNSLLGERFSPPELINYSRRGFCVRHREYIGDISANSAFTLSAYDINPGLFTTFPWLAGVAKNFEQYMLTGMIFEYKTLSADYTTASSAALGYVAMATQYNSLQPVFQDKIHMENYEFANSAKPSESFIHPIECKRALTPTDPLYVRTGPVETSADQRLYDLGKFQIATGGNSGSGILGELWCTYEICFLKPKMNDTDDNVLSAHWRLGTVTGPGPLGTSQTPDSDNSIDLTFSPTTITFPATLSHGKFLLIWNCVGTSTAALVAPTITATSGCTLVQDWDNHVDDQYHQQNGITSVVSFVAWIVTLTDVSAVCTVGGAGTIPANPTSADLHIAQMVI